MTKHHITVRQAAYLLLLARVQDPHKASALRQLVANSFGGRIAQELRSGYARDRVTNGVFDEIAQEKQQEYLTDVDLTLNRTGQAVVREIETGNFDDVKYKEHLYQFDREVIKQGSALLEATDRTVEKFGEFEAIALHNAIAA